MEYKKKIVIFDLGYTIIKHDDAVESSLLSNRLGIPNDEKFLNEISNFWLNTSKYLKNKKIIESAFAEVADLLVPTLKLYGKSGRDFLDALFGMVVIGYYDYSREILSNLKDAGVLVLGLSDWFKKDQERELEELGLLQYFTQVYGWDGCFSKPHPESIKKIMRDIGVFDTSEYVMIGNSLQNDIQAANNCEIDSIWVNRDNEEIKDIIPTYEVKSLKEAEKILIKKR